MSHKHPTAIIMQGGAMRAAFGAGVLYEFEKRGCFADTVAAASASAPTAAYYAARQGEDLKAIWEKEFGDGRIIQYRNIFLGRPIFDIELLIQEVFQKEYPLRTETIAGGTTRLVMPFYNYSTQSLEIRTSVDPDFLQHVWSYLHIAMIIHDQHILRNTPFESYVDGALDPFALYKMQYLPKDARVIVIWNESKFDMHIVKFFGQKLFLALQGRNFPEEIKRMLRIRQSLIDDGMRVYNEFCARYKPVIIKPDRAFFLESLDVISRSNVHLERLFESGRAKARAAFDSGALKDFF